MGFAEEIGGTMVYTGLSYSSWKGRSETKEEKKECHKIQQKKREQEEQIRKRQIENDLTFAKERYGTIGAVTTLFQIRICRRISKLLELLLELT